MSIQDKYNEALANLSDAKDRKRRLENMLLYTREELRGLRAQVPILLNRIYIEGDEGARNELRLVNLDLLEQDQIIRHASTLQASADNAVADAQSTVDQLQAQIDNFTRQAVHWNNEYDRRCNKLARATVFSIDDIEREVMEAATHASVDRAEEAIVMIKLKKEELKNEA